MTTRKYYSKQIKTTLSKDQQQLFEMLKKRFNKKESEILREAVNDYFDKVALTLVEQDFKNG